MEENNIFRSISGILLGNVELAQDFQAVIKEEICRKNHVQHHSGEVCHKFLILRKGINRVFYYKEGKDITCWFSFENDIFTAIDSFF